MNIWSNPYVRFNLPLSNMIRLLSCGLAFGYTGFTFNFNNNHGSLCLLFYIIFCIIYRDLFYFISFFVSFVSPMLLLVYLDFWSALYLWLYDKIYLFSNLNSLLKDFNKVIIFDKINWCFFCYIVGRGSNVNVGNGLPLHIGVLPPHTVDWINHTDCMVYIYRS